MLERTIRSYISSKVRGVRREVFLARRKKGDYVLVVGKLEEVLLKAAVGDLPLNISIKDKVGKFKREKYDFIYTYYTNVLICIC